MVAPLGRREPPAILPPLFATQEPMKLIVDDVTEEPTPLEFTDGADDLSERLLTGAPDWRSTAPLECRLTHYRAGDDLILGGTIRGQLLATCARCAEEFPWAFETPLELVLSPRQAAADPDGALTADDVALGYYAGPEVDLSPLVCEQTLLALPTRPLCREDCLGLCPGCGINMNTTPCTCAAATTAPRLSGIAALWRDK
jgi:uncharacterized protein